MQLARKVVEKWEFAMIDGRIRGGGGTNIGGLQEK